MLTHLDILTKDNDFSTNVFSEYYIAIQKN